MASVLVLPPILMLIAYLDPNPDFALLILVMWPDHTCVRGLPSGADEGLGRDWPIYPDLSRCQSRARRPGRHEAIHAVPAFSFIHPSISRSSSFTSDHP